MMKRSFVKSGQPIVFFFAVIFSLTFLFCSVSYADVIYISSDDCSVNYIREDSAGNFHESKDVLPRITNQVYGELSYGERAPYYHDVAAFRHNNQNKVFVARCDSYDVKNHSWRDMHVMIFDPKDFSAPLASKDISLHFGSYAGGVAEFGNNIIFGYGRALYEMNPETCELIGEPYLMQETPGAEGEVYVHDGMIYATIDDGHVGRLDIMDKVGSVTGSVSFGSEPHKYTPDIVSSGGNLYFSGSEVFRYSFEHGSGEFLVRAGIYLIHHDKIKNLTLTADDLYHNSDYSTQVVSNDLVSFCSDGQGGFYYLLSDDMIKVDEHSYDPVGYHVYRWNGAKSTEVYSSSKAYDGIAYDPTNETLFLLHEHVTTDYSLAFYEYDEYADCLKKDTSGQFRVVQTFHGLASTALINKSSGGSSGGDGTPADPNNNDNTSSLPSAVIEPAGELSQEVMNNLAKLVSKDATDLKLIVNENISSPKEPTQTMKQYIYDDGYEAAYKLNTLTVSNDGYYVFAVNIPDELVGKKVSDVKLYALKNSDFSGSEVNASFFSLVNGLLNYGEITNMFGVKIETLEKKILAVGMLQASTPFSVYLAKILLAILASGCSLSGTGALIICVMCIAMMPFRKK